MTQKERLDAIEHSYAQGFNGTFTKYRIRHLDDYDLFGSVLDVGCGEGQMTPYLLKRFERVVAVEGARRSCETTRKAFPELELYECLFEDFRSDEKFDVVLISGVLEHVPDAQRFLSHARGFLKNGGRLVLTVPNGESLHRRIGMKMGLISSFGELGELDRKVGHYRYYDFDSLKKELSGFEIDVMTGIFVKPFPFSQIEGLSEEYIEGLYRLSRELPRLCAEIFVIAH